MLGGKRASTAENPASTGETRPSPHLENMAEKTSISDIVKVLEKRVRQELNDRLPRRVGVMAVNHFNQNFRDGGFLKVSYLRVALRDMSQPATSNSSFTSIRRSTRILARTLYNIYISVAVNNPPFFISLYLFAKLV